MTDLYSQPSPSFPYVPLIPPRIPPQNWVRAYLTQTRRPSWRQHTIEQAMLEDYLLSDFATGDQYGTALSPIIGFSSTRWCSVS